MFRMIGIKDTKTILHKKVNLILIDQLSKYILDSSRDARIFIQLNNLKYSLLVRLLRQRKFYQ